MRVTALNVLVALCLMVFGLASAESTMLRELQGEGTCKDGSAPPCGSCKDGTKPPCGTCEDGSKPPCGTCEDGSKPPCGTCDDGTKPPCNGKNGGGGGGDAADDGAGDDAVADGAGDAGAGDGTGAAVAGGVAAVAAVGLAGAATFRRYKKAPESELPGQVDNMGVAPHYPPSETQTGYALGEDVTAGASYNDL